MENKTNSMTNDVKIKKNQIISFEGLEYSKITPTDLDELIRIRDVYVFVEIKYKDTAIENIQRVMLERTINNFTRVGGKAIALLVSHEIEGGTITSKDLKINKMYQKGSGWKTPKEAMTLESFIEKYKAKGVTDEEIYYSKLDAVVELKNKAYMFVETTKDKEKTKLLMEIANVLNKAGKDAYVLFTKKEESDELILKDCEVDYMYSNNKWYKKENTKVNEMFEWFFDNYLTYEGNR